MGSRTALWNKLILEEKEEVKKPFKVCCFRHLMKTTYSIFSYVESDEKFLGC
jgi:hypothetical protein